VRPFLPEPRRSCAEEQGGRGRWYHGFRVNQTSHICGPPLSFGAGLRHVNARSHAPAHYGRCCFDGGVLPIFRALWNVRARRVSFESVLF
jgi:hypothetical protein